MAVHTDYDEKRDQLRDMLSECLDLARELLNEDIWGYDEMCEDYAINVYQAVKRTRDAI